MIERGNRLFVGQKDKKLTVFSTETLKLYNVIVTKGTTKKILPISNDHILLAEVKGWIEIIQLPTMTITFS